MQWQTFVQDFVHLECFNCINIFNGITFITNYYSPFNHQKIIKNKFFARKVSKHFTIQATRSLCNFSIVVRQNGHQTCHLLTTCPFDYSGTHEKEKKHFHWASKLQRMQKKIRLNVTKPIEANSIQIAHKVGWHVRHIVLCHCHLFISMKHPCLHPL